MSKQLRISGAFSIAAMLMVTLFTAHGSGAAAHTPLALSSQTETSQTSSPQSVETVATPDSSSPRFVSQPVVQPLAPAGQAADNSDADLADNADSLRELVADQTVPTEMSSELKCLAGAVYFESKGETLEGQLAVARVIVARSKSGRFPASYCGVVYQRSQFSFVHGDSMPSINSGSPLWANAEKIAMIAHEGTWQSPVEGALFFHAARVSPNWRLTKLARIDNHIFYR